MTGRVAKVVRISGRVQGVWYRGWTRDEALARGLTGWVRNAPDGSVDAHIEGPEAAVAAMITAFWQGPPAASVSSLEAEVCNPLGTQGFEIKR